MIHVALLLGCAVAIYLACEWFVNAVEWFGVEFKMGALAVGTILAAAGTALPESVVTLVAVLFGSKAQGNDIAVGAAMGGPLVVGTVAYGVTGAMLLLHRRAQSRARASVAAGVLSRAEVPEALRDDGLADVDTERLAKDQSYFLVIFAAKVGLGLIAFALKPALGILFFAVYGVYFWREMRADGVAASADDLEPLRFQPRRDVPARWAVVAQTLVMVSVIFVASELFVRQLEWAGPALGLSPVVVALLLSPIATELPEVLNAIIWVRAGKTELALANISGAMMIQATVPSGIGILFTPWKFDAPLLLSGAVTASAVVYLLCLLRARRLTPVKLAATGGFYLAFAAGLVFVG